MKDLLIRLFFLSIMGCGLAACGSQPPVVATLTPTPAVLYRDVFDPKAENWDKFVEPGKGEAGYDEGQYRIKVVAKNYQVWANPKHLQLPDDVHIYVEAIKRSGDSNNIFGVICRYKDAKNFYFLVISSDSHFGIGKVKDGQYELINRLDYPPNPDLPAEIATAKIEVDCRGDLLRLTVNGKLIDEQHDSDFKNGNVGLIAGTFGEETVINFDNFEVKGP